MTLKEALRRLFDNDEEAVEDVICDMVDRVNSGEDPEEVLYDEGLEPDYVIDLINEI